MPQKSVSRSSFPVSRFLLHGRILRRRAMHFAPGGVSGPQADDRGGSVITLPEPPQRIPPGVAAAVAISFSGRRQQSETSLNAVAKDAEEKDRTLSRRSTLINADEETCFT
jgi:hypothetical protein